MTNTIRRVYVFQFDRWWGLTPFEWRLLCESGAAGNGYVLPDRRLKRRPPHVGVERIGGSGRTYYSLNPKLHAVVEPLDWDIDDFKDALKGMKK